MTAKNTFLVLRRPMDSFLKEKMAIRDEVLRIFFESYKEIVIICIKKYGSLN